MRIDRERQQQVQDGLDLADNDPEAGTAAFLAQTVSMGNYPNTATSVFAIQFVDLDVAEVEGATPSFSPDASRTLFALNLGTNVPNTGTVLLVDSPGGRLSFRFDG